MRGYSRGNPTPGSSDRSMYLAAGRCLAAPRELSEPNRDNKSNRIMKSWRYDISHKLECNGREGVGKLSGRAGGLGSCRGLPPYTPLVRGRRCTGTGNPRDRAPRPSRPARRPTPHTPHGPPCVLAALVGYHQR